MKARHLTIALLLVLSMSVPGAIRAQDVTPEPGKDASRFLPDAAEFGDGWTLDQIVSPDQVARYYFEMSPDVFREGAVGIYLGPNGARVVAVSLLLTESRVAIRQSWEDASDLLDSIRGRTDYDYTRESDLESMDPPDGCVEAKRSEGTENLFLVPIGTKLCAVDPDIVILVSVSGAFNELSGIAASDAVVQSMLKAGAAQ